MLECSRRVHRAIPARYSRPRLESDQRARIGFGDSEASKRVLAADCGSDGGCEGRCVGEMHSVGDERSDSETGFAQSSERRAHQGSSKHIDQQMFLVHRIDFRRLFRVQKE